MTDSSSSFQCLSTEQKKKSLKDLMSQSTIYHRHETRALKSMANRDDPRPKVVRVLSGLPGFRTFIPPYVPSAIQEQSSSPVESTNKTISANFGADETVVRFSLPTTSVASRSTNVDSIHQLETTVPPHYIALSTAALGAFTECCYGAGVSKKPVGHASPFQLASMTSNRAPVPLMQEGGSGSLFRLAFAKPSSTIWNGPSTTPHAKGAQLLSGAASASLLFGVKVFTEQYLAKGKEQEDLSAFSWSALASSAMAGVAVAAMSPFQSCQAQFLRNPTALSSPLNGVTDRLMQPSMLLPRHILGASIYFSSYEIMKSFFSTSVTLENHSSISTSSHPSPLSVLFSGAVAGALYQGTLVYSMAVPMHASVPATTTTSIPVRMLPCMFRAAPAHALLFLGYEWVLVGYKTKQ